MNSDLGVLFVIVYFVVAFGITIFIIILFWRITIALEKMARHQLEIARDVKKLAHGSNDAEEE